MANVLVRDLEPSVVDRLKLRAKRQERSLQAELNSILTEVANRPDPLTEMELLRKFRNSIKNKQQTDSAILLREDRDR